MKKNFLHKCKDSKKFSWEEWKSFLESYNKTFMNFQILLRYYWLKYDTNILYNSLLK